MKEMMILALAVVSAAAFGACNQGEALGQMARVEIADPEKKDSSHIDTIREARERPFRELTNWPAPGRE